MRVDIFTTENRYDIIYADPPWKYSDQRCKGACAYHYKTLSEKEMGILPISKIAKKDCVLFIWATYPKLLDALELIGAWGFTYKTIAFQWIKLNKRVHLDSYKISTLEEDLHKSCFFGLGRWTRGNTECCLLATKGKPRRISNSVSQLIFAPITVHSEKPPIVREKIVDLLGFGNKIELFARQQVAGWDCWGNEV